MRIRELNITKGDAYKKLWPILKENIFHLTSAKNAKKILKDGMIKGDVTLEKIHEQSMNSYGRKRSLICLFDLRNSEAKEKKEAYDKFDFIRPEYISEPYYFIIDDKLHRSLVDWETAQKEVGYSEIFIPYIECWYSQEIPVKSCKQIIRVNFQWDGNLDTLSIAELDSYISKLEADIEKAKKS